MTPAEPNQFGGTFVRTTHSGPWDYLQEVPLVFYGAGFRTETSVTPGDREVTVADIAPTLAELLGVPFPKDLAGRPIAEALAPNGQKPRLVVVVAWDGGGWNLLNEWPDAWPFLRSLMEGGTSINHAIVGSSPSVTPPIHTTMGTGAFPNQHGIVDIFVRLDGQTRNAYADMDPSGLRIETLADIYDRALDNEPLVALVAKDGWHVGMMGHGAAIEGADKDIAVVETKDGTPFANEDFYELPDYIDEIPGIEEDVRTLDSVDGAVDGKWLGNEVSVTDGESVTNSPARTLFQARVLEEIVKREGFGTDDVTDLIFTNFKQIDISGHTYNMASEESEMTIEFTDRAMKSFFAFLDEHVGKDRWAMVMTADHGQGPAPELTGGWAANIDRVEAYVTDAVGEDDEKLFQKVRPTGFWLDPSVEDKDGTAIAISNALAEYTAADDAQGDAIPDFFAGDPDDPIFESVFPTAQIGSVIDCARER